MIMYSNKIAFPGRHSAQWADFVRQALEKKPHLRPSAHALLDHAWVKCAPGCSSALYLQHWQRIASVPLKGMLFWAMYGHCKQQLALPLCRRHQHWQLTKLV